MSFFFSVLLILSSFTSLVESGSSVLIAGNLTLGTKIVENVPATLSGLNVTTGIHYDLLGRLHITQPATFQVRSMGKDGIIKTTLGSGEQSNDGADALPSTVKFDGVHSVVMGNVDGDIYISSGNYFIWRYYESSTGAVKRFAGKLPATLGFDGDGGAPTAATLNRPMGMTADSDGGIYFADYGNNRVRYISSNVNTVAGNGVAGYSGDGGPGTSASLSGPTSLSFDAMSGLLYIADTGNNCIRVFKTYGQKGISTLLSGLNKPMNIFVPYTGIAYFTEGCSVMAYDGTTLTRYMGSSSCGVQQDAAIIPATDPISAPKALTIDQSNPGAVYYAESNIIRQFSPQEAPTRSPTMRPTTASPTTVSPTFSPSTLTPTFSPSTVSPTTVSPTFSPSTVSPTTSSPTFSPSTLTPTFAPSTVSPTHSPTLQPTNATVASSSSSSKSERLSDINIFYATFFPALLVLIVLAVFLCCYWNTIAAGSEKEKNTYEQVEKDVEKDIKEKTVVERQRYYELWI